MVELFTTIFGFYALFLILLLYFTLCLPMSCRLSDAIFGFIDDMASGNPRIIVRMTAGSKFCWMNHEFLVFHELARPRFPLGCVSQTTTQNYFFVNPNRGSSE